MRLPTRWSAPSTCLVFVIGCGGDAPIEPVDKIPASVSVSMTTAALASLGETVQVTAIVRDADGVALSVPVSWKTDLPSVASVSATGVITAVGNGTTTITASAGSVSATVAVTVKQEPNEITLSSSAVRLTPGASASLQATVKDARGGTIQDAVVSWTTSDLAVATVTPSGAVTAVAAGVATITAQAGTASVTASVTVSSVAAVGLTAPSNEAHEGHGLQLTATVTDHMGAPVTGVPVTWTSDSLHIATVDASGLVTGVRAGVTRIRASADGVEGSILLTVRGLLHRWTFSETGGAGTAFVDDVGGKQATIAGTAARPASAIAGMVTLTGGPRAEAAYVALPSGLLSGKTDATIEVWATLHSLKLWSRVFDIGASPASNLFMAWSHAVDPMTDRTAFTVNGVEHRLDRVFAPFTIDVQHHVVLSIDDGGSGGKTRLTMYLDGALRGSFETTYRLRDLNDTDFWLGRSHYVGDETANASYDEVRVHDRAFSAADAQQSYLRGPVRSGGQSSITILPPAGMRDTVRGVGVEFKLRAVGKDQLGRQFPVGGAQWTSSNPTVATVDATTGTVRALGAGATQFTVTAGSATAQWTVEVVRIRRVAVDPYLATPAAGALWEIPVVLIAYLPTADGFSIDTLKNPDFWAAIPLSLDTAEARVLAFAKRKKMSLEEGSRFRGYKVPTAAPSLAYRVVEHIIVYELEPADPNHRDPRAPNPALAAYYPNFFQIFDDLQLTPLMTSHRIKEIWLADSGFDSGYPSYNPAIHKPEHFRTNHESNMASPLTGDISNSWRFPNDLPILPHTYVVYGINYRRSQAEAVHNVGHQIEHMLSYVAGRQDGNDRLFWRDFVGHVSGDVFGTGRAGWTHMPPNTNGNYDYLNPTLVMSDIEDWRPNNSGQKKAVNVDTWGKLTYPWPGAPDFGQRVESQWYVYWFQNMPGRGNTIPHGSRWMTNWWAFVGDWDAAIKSGLGLHASTQAAARGANVAYPHAAPAVRRAPVVHRPERP